MDKKKFVSFVQKQLESDYETLKKAALATYEAATHEESKAENEYDTRGLEASYLAGAQAKRLAEIEELFTLFKFIQLKDFAAADPIAATALVEISLKGKRSFVFLSPKGGGMNVAFEGQIIQIITPNSPLGEALLDLHAGDTAMVGSGDREIEYQILSVK